MTHTRIALCSDTHFWPDAPRSYGSDGEQLQPWSEQIRGTLLTELELAAPDLTLHLGDLTCGGGSFEMPPEIFFETLPAMIKAFRDLPGQFYALPGNHDCPPEGDWRYAEDLLGLAPGQGATIDLPEARLILLNTQGHPPEQIAAALPNDPTYGWVSEAELARLAEALETVDDRPILVFTHQLLRPWVGPRAWKDLYGTANTEAALDLLARNRQVRAVFQAHAHRLDVQQAPLGDKSCWFVVMPAIICYPLAWLQLELSPESMQVSMKRLPLPALADLSRNQGEGHEWRAGRPEWQNFTIPLFPAQHPE
jgi:3',5'-cyclic AMP phosphodiesterase CpdA